MARQPKSGLGLLTVEVSRSHTSRHVLRRTSLNGKLETNIDSKLMLMMCIDKYRVYGIFFDSETNICVFESLPVGIGV